MTGKTPRKRLLPSIHPVIARGFAAALVAAAMLVLAVPVQAQSIESAAKQILLIDTTTDTVLLEKNSEERMKPSSMSKIMTVFAVFERLKDGRLSLEDTLPVSEKAWRKGGSKMFVAANSRVKVEDLIRGIIVQSGNDATIVVAEGLAGSEEAFGEELNERAKELGMMHSHFVNASGWPDPDHYTTAHDLALLARYTVEKFPEYYHYYSEKSFTYNGIRQGNRNPLLYRDVGADGLKTGHTEEAGYGLTASAIRNGRRLILVLNGLPSQKARAQESERLIDWGFREFDNYTLFRAGETVTDAAVWMGVENAVPLVIEKDVTVTLPRKARRDMEVSVVFDGPIPAPITTGTELAKLRITAPEQEPVELPLVAGHDIEQLGMFSRFGAALKFIIWGEEG